MMSTYTALVSRDGKFWHIEVPEIDRVTQARNINEVDDMARDLIAIKDSIEPDSFELDIRIPEARSHAATEPSARDTKRDTNSEDR